MFSFFRTILEKLADTRKSGHYVAARVSKESTSDLKAWCNTNKIPVSSDFFDNLHVTLCYSTTLFDIDQDSMIDDIADWKVTCTEFDLFGKDSANQYLVIKIKSPQCTTRWKHYIDQGASYDFDKYLPHISIAQGWAGDIGDLDVQSLPSITLASEYYEKLS